MICPNVDEPKSTLTIPLSTGMISCSASWTNASR